MPECHYNGKGNQSRDTETNLYFIVERNYHRMYFNKKFLVAYFVEGNRKFVEFKKDHLLFWIPKVVTG